MPDLGEQPDRWTCRWCLTYRHPVVHFVTAHEELCVAKPEVVT